MSHETTTTETSNPTKTLDANQLHALILHLLDNGEAFLVAPDNCDLMKTPGLVVRESAYRSTYVPAGCQLTQEETNLLSALRLAREQNTNILFCFDGAKGLVFLQDVPSKKMLSSVRAILKNGK